MQALTGRALGVDPATSCLIWDWDRCEWGTWRVGDDFQLPPRGRNVLVKHWTNSMPLSLGYRLEEIEEQIRENIERVRKPSQLLHTLY